MSGYVDFGFWVQYALIGVPMFGAGYVLRSAVEAERRRARAERLHPSRQLGPYLIPPPLPQWMTDELTKARRGMRTYEAKHQRFDR